MLPHLRGQLARRGGGKGENGNHLPTHRSGVNVARHNSPRGSTKASHRKSRKWCSVGRLFGLAVCISVTLCVIMLATLFLDPNSRYSYYDNKDLASVGTTDQPSRYANSNDVRADQRHNRNKQGTSRHSDFVTNFDIFVANTFTSSLVDTTSTTTSDVTSDDILSWEEEKNGKIRVLSELSYKNIDETRKSKPSLTLKVAYFLSRYAILKPVVLELTCQVQSKKYHRIEKIGGQDTQKTPANLIKHLISKSSSHSLQHGQDSNNVDNVDYRSILPNDLIRHFDANAKAKPPLPLVQEKDSEDQKVFVGISTYRDYRCGHTLQNLFSRAAYPSRVQVGVVDQILPGDAPCLSYYCRRVEINLHLDEKRDIHDVAHETGITKIVCPFVNQIRFLPLDASHFNFGPIVARGRQNMLIRDETFCMQCDAHSDFHPQWDSVAISSFKKTDNEMAVLSTYPNDMKPDMTDYQWDGEYAPRIEGVDFTADPPDLPRNHQAGQLLIGGKHNKPMRQRFWGAGVSFSKCHAMINVRNDPSMKGIFDGEEYSFASRLWTSGYELFTPWPQFVVHDYEHKSLLPDAELKKAMDLVQEGTEPHIYSTDGGSSYANEQRAAERKLKRLFRYGTTVRKKDNNSEQLEYFYGEPGEWHDNDIDFGIYGMGKRRSYEKYMKFSEMDTVNHNVAQWYPPDEPPDDIHAKGPQFVPYEWDLSIYGTGGYEGPSKDTVSWKEWLKNRSWEGKEDLNNLLVEAKQQDEERRRNHLRQIKKNVVDVDNVLLHAQNGWIRNSLKLVSSLPVSLVRILESSHHDSPFDKRFQGETVEWEQFLHVLQQISNVSNFVLPLDNSESQNEIRCSVHAATVAKA
eukprot:g1380.t1